VNIGGRIMKVQLYIITIIIGLFLGLHLAMNAKVGSVVNNPRVGNAVFWVIGAIMAVIIGLTGWEAGVLSRFKDVNLILLTAGALGACLVFYTAWAIPQIGAGPTFAITLTGWIIFGVIASHFGWLGSPVQSISFMKVIGIILMLSGVSMAVL